MIGQLSSQAQERLMQVASETAQREGCQLYDLELTGKGRQRTLRVFIFDPEKGVTIDQCAQVSNGLSLLLDVEDLIPGGTYDLEVSSPGLDRPLRYLWHFESAIGSKVRVRTTEPIALPEGSHFTNKTVIKKVEGQLVGVEQEELLVNDERYSWKIPLSIVHQANVVYEFDDKWNAKQKGKKS